MSDTVYIIVLVILFLVAVFVIPQWRMRRELRQVIKKFRDNEATSASRAVMPEQVGIRPPRGIVQTLLSGRDYKRYVVEGLVKAGIVKQLEDGRLYLDEGKMSSVKL